MQIHRVICAILAMCAIATAKDTKPLVPEPTEFQLGLHTFFDFGPPFDFYELFLVHPSQAGTTIERITVTPPGDACTQPAKVEIASGSASESISALLGNTNPCSISEKDLRRELKRCKHCLVFSGANLSLQVQCGTENRIIRADILDRDMFDANPKTPVRTSWTMSLLAKLQNAVGPGVMERPIFSMLANTDKAQPTYDSSALGGVAAGKYDLVFAKSPHKISELYAAAQVAIPAPTVQLTSISVQPDSFKAPIYPPIARAAHVQGPVTFKADIGANGHLINLKFETAHPMLRGVVEAASAAWEFPKSAAGRNIEATITFNMNCPANKQQP